MPNPNQPTIQVGSTGDAVKRLQRALRRTAELSITVDGHFTPQLQTMVKSFQSDNGLTADGVVGPQTWAKLPDGRPMPLLHQGSSGAVVKRLQDVLTIGANEWNVTPQGIDGDFGPKTKASVEALQTWGGVTADGIVGDRTWSVSLHAASATLESVVGLNFVVGT
jgi:peptidoglycan hydrolase-like protein with peptidoglycan-binding domain